MTEAREAGRPNGVEHISPELLPRLGSIQAVGFDMDDTLVERNRAKLAVKLQQFTR